MRALNALGKFFCSGDKIKGLLALGGGVLLLLGLNKLREKHIREKEIKKYEDMKTLKLQQIEGGNEKLKLLHP